VFKNKKMLVLSSVVTLLPMLAGLILWNKLPSVMPTHWGADGAVDGTSGRAFVVFGLPLLFWVFNLICLWGTGLDKRNRQQHPKVTGMVQWIIPILSCFSCAAVYSVALGQQVNVPLLSMVPLALVFIVMGNYMPKTKQNFTIGIKVKWTLMSEENWAKTHRLAGKLWVAGGILLLFSIFLPLKVFPVVLVGTIAIMAGVPMAYSWWYYRQQLSSGEVDRATSRPLPPGMKTAQTIGILMAVVICIGVGILLVTGNIDFQLNDTSLTIEASYYQDLTVEYAAMDSVEYVEDFDTGLRVGGFGSARLLMGNFQTDDLGTFTLYAYTKADDAILIRCGDRELALAGKTDADTFKLYEALMEKVK